MAEMTVFGHNDLRDAGRSGRAQTGPIVGSHFAGTSSGDRDSLGKAQQLLVDAGRIDPWSAASWFLTGHPDPDGRDPLDWVRSGAQDRLLAAAGRDAACAAQ